MTILDKVQIGKSVKVNIELSKDIHSKEVIDALKISPFGTIIDFRTTDGKGIGVILKLSNGKEKWFFENEIDLLDENGVVMEKEFNISKSNNLIYDIFNNLRYENKNKVGDLINPINFMLWLIVSFKDNF